MNFEPSKFLGWIVVVAAACLVLAGCDAPDARTGPPTAYPYRIVATVGMVADIARNVAGDKAVVDELMGEGVDPHLYRATRDDVAKMLKGDVVFYSGLLLEGKMGDVLDKLGQRRIVVPVTETIDPSYLLQHAQLGHADPHVWMDPQAWSQAVDVVADTLAQFDPANAPHYRRNAEEYKRELAALGEYGRRVIATVPKGSRILITSHDAFSYFGRAFDIEVRGVQGLSTESEAGLRQVNELVDLLVERDVQAVFVETSVPRKSIEALINGARSRGHDVRIGGTLFSDAMGSAGTYEGTYIGMIDHNITTVARALGGTAPAAGLNGRLAAHE